MDIKSQVTIRTKKLGVLIRDARLAARRSAQECAEAIDIRKGLFRAYEDGLRAPSLPELEALVYYLDLPIDHFWGKSVFRAVFTTIAVFVVGAPIWLIMLYQSLSAFLSQFNHANISLPPWLDKTIGWLIVSPNMHKVHHHYVRPQTDSNYGNIFSVWDRIFGTYNNTSASEIRFGLDVLEGRRVDDLAEQLKLPFDKTVKTDY